MTELTVIIPCRNEERFIGGCLDSVLMQDYPEEQMEVLVIDGMSEDSTRDVIQDYLERHPRISLIENPDKIVSTALNAGIRQARGDFVMRLDAHAEYPRNYISKCVSYLKLHEVDNVGGILETVPGRGGAIPEAIALAMSSAFGVGNSYFRTGTRCPREVDTVPFGCYRRDVFARIGYFDEDLVRNQDDEFNLRLTNHGGRIMLFPDIYSRYHARESLGKVWKMFYQYGYLKPLVAAKVGGVMTRRQMIPSVFVLAFGMSGLAAIVLPGAAWAFAVLCFLYLGAAALESVRIAWNNPGRALVLPLVFAAMHFSYGLGYLRGTFEFRLRRKSRRARNKELRLTR